MSEQSRAPTALILFLASVFIAAAVASPGLYLLLHTHLDYAFHSYVDRCLMITALAGLFLFWRAFGLRSAGEIGLGWERKGELWGGLLLGVVSAALVMGGALAVGGRVLAGSASVGVLLTILIGAVLLAPLEEILFRGVVQTILVRALRAPAGIIAGSLLFAFLHFIKVPSDFAPNPVTAWSGWQAVGLSFGPLFGLGWAQPRFVLLVGIGLVLGLAAWRTGRLWLPIGLHAGWIVGLKLGNRLTDGVPGHWAAGDFASNPLSFAALALTGLVVWKWPHSSST